MFSEVSQTEKDKYWIFKTYLCNLKYKANKKSNKTTHRYRESTSYHWGGI